MKRSDPCVQESEALQSRLLRLSEASLRINENLDLGTVLREVLDSARSLTEARYGAMTLVDDSGAPADFLSSGMTDEEARQLWNLPDGTSFFESLGGIRGPLRVPDLSGHVRSLGLPELGPRMAAGASVPLLAAPIFHREERVGSIYLAVKEGGVEFTLEDEGTLVLFASQAALVMANARRYRAQQRARVDLETLIDTCPIGVVVFDAKTEPRLRSTGRRAGSSTACASRISRRRDSCGP